MKELLFNYSEKNFIVSGASSGIGYQTMIELLESGARVFAIARNINELEKLKSRYEDRLFISNNDIRNVSDIKFDIDLFKSFFGKFDGLVYCAGIDKITSLKVYDEKVVKDIMDINFFAAVNIIQLFTKKAYSKNEASIVLCSSISSKIGVAGQFAYSASKASMNIFSKSIAKEISKRKLRINTVCLGRVKTKMNNSFEISEDIVLRYLLGIGNTDDVSGVILFLLSNRAKWITGADLIIDGGFLSN